MEESNPKSTSAYSVTRPAVTSTVPSSEATGSASSCDGNVMSDSLPATDRATAGAEPRSKPLGADAYNASTGSSACSFVSVSASSAAGWESRTTPTPA